MELISLYGQPFPRYRKIFKIAIFEHETWPLSKVPEVAQTLSFSPRGVEIGVVFALWTVKEVEQIDLNYWLASLINCYHYQK